MAPVSAVVKSLHGKFGLEIFYMCANSVFWFRALIFPLTACGKAGSGVPTASIFLGDRSRRAFDMCF